MQSQKKTYLNSKRYLISRSVFDWVGGFGAEDIAIDLGTQNTVVYIRGKGVVISEPSVVLLDTLSREVRAVGRTAAMMSGRVPQGLELVRPVTHGVVTDYAAAVILVRSLVAACGTWRWSRPRVIITTATSLKDIELRASLETVLQIGARKVVRMEAPLAAAYGAGLDTVDSLGLLVVDLGAGTTDMAIVNASGILHSEVEPIGGHAWDRGIVRQVMAETGVEIGVIEASFLKHRLGSMREVERSETIYGRSIKTGLPQAVVVDAAMVRRALQPMVDRLVERMERILAWTKPEVSDWVRQNGVLLVGGGSLLDGLAIYLTHRIGVPVLVDDNPLFRTVVGAGKALEEMDLFRDTLSALG